MNPPEDWKNAKPLKNANPGCLGNVASFADRLPTGRRFPCPQTKGFGRVDN